MAFSPDYAVSGRFYVFPTTGTAGDFDVEVWEFRVSANPDVADAASARRVIVVPHDDATNHIGGQLAFGPDGYLYVGVGDGGLQGDPMNRAQDPTLLLGKILRIDPRGTAPDAHGFPPGNAPGAAPQVWALGLRNPWRFSFDRVTGALVIGDVGFDTYEEIDLLPLGTPGGTNFGWRNYEGLHLRSGQPALANAVARSTSTRTATRPTRARSRAATSCRTERARARGPLRLRRLLRRLGAQPGPDRPGGERRSPGRRRRPRPRSRLLRRGRALPGLPADRGRPGLPPRPAPRPAPRRAARRRGRRPRRRRRPTRAPRRPCTRRRGPRQALQRLGTVLRSGLSARCGASAAATCVVTASVNADHGAGARSALEARSPHDPRLLRPGHGPCVGQRQAALRLRLTNVARRHLAARKRPSVRPCASRPSSRRPACGSRPRPRSSCNGGASRAIAARPQARAVPCARWSCSKSCSGSRWP